ncbi:MAG: hypothetical protein ACRD19_00260 [Terriglobia bacterium]
MQRLQAGDHSVWSELWDNLHHQGDVDFASYAALPYVLAAHRLQGMPEWNAYALAGTIELCRNGDWNRALPGWLAAGYEAAWANAPSICCSDLPDADDEITVRSIMSVLAVAKRLRVHAEVLLHFSAAELLEIMPR